MKFNLNDKIKVKLTDFGIDVLNKHFSNLKLENIFKIDTENDNEIEIQIWDMANIFGDYLYMGGQSVFKDMNVELINPPQITKKKIEIIN